MEKTHLNIKRRGFLGLGAATVLAGQTRVQRTRPSGSIDCHTHWTPDPYRKALAEIRRPAGGTGAANPLDYDLEQRIAWMNEHGVQMHVLTLSGQMPWQWAPPDVRTHLPQLVNDAAIEAHAKHPYRFLGGIEVDVRDP